MAARSAASSAASNLSVSHQGEEKSVEQVIKETTIACQNGLTNLELHLSLFALHLEQETGDTPAQELEEFQKSVRFRDEVVDAVSDMERWLDELPAIATDLVGKPPKGAAAWYREHVAERKKKIDEENAAYKAAADAAKAAKKAAKEEEKKEEQAAKLAAKGVKLR